MLARLHPLVRRCITGASNAVDLRRLTGGASQAIWSFDALTPQGRVPLIMRCAQHWSARDAASSAGMTAEVALLRLAEPAGVPVPGVRTELLPEDGLGEGYLMDRVAGETQGRKLLRDPALAAVRPKLAADCGAIMARIHAMPWSALPPLRCGFALDESRAWAARFHAGGSVRPVFEWALRWLLANAPAPNGEAVLVHGDFRNGNLLIGPGGVQAVLDWELAHLGDPMEDLGWFCVNAWRFGNIDLPAGGFGTREDLFAGYECAGGQVVDPARVHFWEVFGTLKWGIVCDGMGHAFSSGADPGLERAAIGRRASEAEIDLMNLLAPRA